MRRAEAHALLLLIHIYWKFFTKRIEGFAVLKTWCEKLKLEETDPDLSILKGSQNTHFWTKWVSILIRKNKFEYCNSIAHLN